MENLLFGIYFILILSFIGWVKSTPIGGEYLGSYKYTNYTLKDIQTFDVIKCNEDKECPDYSNGCETYSYWNGEIDIEYNLCDMTFMCHNNDTCYSLHNASTYYINVKGMEYGISFVSNSTIKQKEFEEKDKLIFHSCDKSMYKHNLCETDTCHNPSNCYSNLCINETCMKNKNIPSYICRIDWVKEDEKPGMQCKFANGEDCSYDEDCDLVNVCDDKYSVCTSPLIAVNHQKPRFPDYLFFFGVAITIIIILAIIVLITLFVMSCIYVAMDELKNILYNIGDDYRQLESN